MVAYLEHVNMTVPNIDAAIAFLLVVEPSLTVRHDETPKDSYRWAHVGADNCYIALQEPQLDSDPTDCHRPYKDYGVNHVGWVVEDMDATIGRLRAAGYEEGIPGEENRFRRRAYFYDSAGFEWEIVAYETEDLTERYSYE